MTSGNRASENLSAAQWRIVALLVFSVFINYVDRGNLSVAAPQLKAELRLTPTNLGLLLSAFSWTYAIGQLFGGWLVDRFNVRLVYGAGFVLWSLATAGTGLVSTFATLLMFRLLLGIGECVSYPSYSKILAGNFPERHRGVANALIDAGSKLGPAIGTFLGAMIVSHFGWRPLFYILGFGSLIWVVPWFVWGPRDTALAVSASENAPSMLEIASKRDSWGTFFGLFCGNYVWYFLINWLPYYLVEMRHFSMDKMAVFASLPFVGIAVGATIGGYLSDHWIAAGKSPTIVRKGFIVAGFLLALPMVLVAVIPDETTALTVLIGASVLFGFYSSNLWAVTQSIAGPSAAGKWTGMQNGFGNLAGIIGPALTGWIVEQTGSFVIPFAILALLLVGGAVSFWFIVGPVKPIQWSTNPAERAAAS